MANAGGLKEKIRAWGAAHLGFVFCLLRNTFPIVNIRGFAIVTRFTDVLEVLSRDDAFAVTYEEKMRIVTGGENFFLGMGPGARYTQDVSNMRVAFRGTDIEDLVIPLLERTAFDLVERSGGKIDAVAELSRVVPAILVEEYMGISAPSREELIEWATEIFAYLFFPDVPEETVKRATDFSAKARTYIDGLISNRKASGEQKDDALGRLLKMQNAETPGLSDEDIRNNLLGIVIGAIPTTSKCATLVLDYLLDHPKSMEGARKAALDKDWRTLNKYVLESLRFNPFAAGVLRQCIADYKIAKGTLRGRTIRKGTKVLVATQSAMWDGRELSRPGRFDPARPEYQYIPYGYGMHTCFGLHINHVQIAIIVGSLISRDGLRRAAGEAGQVRKEGEFPTHLSVTFNV